MQAGYRVHLCRVCGAPFPTLRAASLRFCSVRCAHAVTRAVLRLRSA